MSNVALLIFISKVIISKVWVLFFASGEEKSFITLTPGLPGSEGSHGTPARFPPIGHPEPGSFLVGRKNHFF